MNWLYSHHKTKLQSLAEMLHLAKPETTSQKIVNSLLHLVLYFTLIIFGYLLAQLQNLS